MYTTLLLISLFIDLRPFKRQGMLHILLFNLIMLLYLSYLQLLFTDFVSQTISDSTGNQFLFVTIVIIVVNIGYVAFLGLNKLYIEARV